MQWLELGGRHIDTAHDYGTEPDVGKAIRLSNVPRKEIFITTKIPGPIGRDAVKTLVLNETLPKLGTEYVDLLLIHTPCLERSDFPNKCGSKLRAERLDTYRGLMELRAAGKIRAIGETRSQLRVTVRKKLAACTTLAVEWHLAYHNETLRQRMESSSVRLEAWASLAGPTGQGALQHEHSSAGTALGNSARRRPRDRHLLPGARGTLADSEGWIHRKARWGEEGRRKTPKARGR
ncbi:unnamed protein product [Durusdinium trenchii]|uniref:NADP-dependent oxidoreductase domain-containing protein n=1 Tax=Durusdinium trenchii TaxID=1381693 RepID=A0ABP0MC60_9DINO